MMTRTKLSQKQKAALNALLETGSLTEAAEMAGISRRTLYEYLHNNADFSKAYEEVRQRQTVSIMEALDGHKDRAYQILGEIMEDPDQPAGIRIKAAHELISASQRLEDKADSIAYQNTKTTNSLSALMGFDD